MVRKSIGWGFGRCNMNCRHCYAASGDSCPQYELDKLEGIAEKIGPYTSAINYGTGEFGFNMNAIPLAEFISERYLHIHQAVTTNGSIIRIIDPKKLRTIFHDVDISIDYPDPERHNRFRRHDRAWKWAMEALEICHNEGIAASIVTCVTGVTTDDDIKKLLELAREKRASWRINWFRPTGRGKQNDTFSLNPERVWNVLKLLSESTEIEALSDPLFDSILGTNYNSYSGCACGVNSCRIQTNLSVTPCVFLGGKRWSGGSILKKNLEQIFASKTFTNFRARKPEFCLRCEFWEKCRGGCSSRAVLYRGSLDEPDGFCPIVNGLDLDGIRNISLRFQGEKRSLVHDGYLCTLITRP